MYDVIYKTVRGSHFVWKTTKEGKQIKRYLKGPQLKSLLESGVTVVRYPIERPDQPKLRVVRKPTVYKPKRGAFNRFTQSQIAS